MTGEIGGNPRHADRAQWYALRVKPNFEASVANILGGRGIATLNPTYRSLRRWSDRTKYLDLPLFPGYVLCRFDAASSLPVRSCPGVLHIVAAGSQPIPLDPDEVEAVRRISLSGLPAQPAAAVALGEHVTIAAGPLKGVTGTVIRLKGANRLVASISLLQRAVAVELDEMWISVPAPASATGSLAARY